MLTDGGERKTPSWAVPLVVAGFLLALVLAVLLAVLWWQHRRLRYSIRLMSTDVYDDISADGEQPMTPTAQTADAAAQKTPVDCLNAGKNLADDGYIDRQTLRAQLQVPNGHITARHMSTDNFPMMRIHSEKNPAMHEASEDLSDSTPHPNGYILTQQNFQDYVEPVSPN